MRPLVAGVVAMTLIVAASNFLVRIPINDWLTWGALSYPAAFLVTDLINRRLGPGMARWVVYVGFACGVALSLFTSTARIALASGTAFLLAQLVDVWLYDRMRRLAWWRAPLVSSTLASALDTALFFCLAFAFTRAPVDDLGARRLCREDRCGLYHAGSVPVAHERTRSRKYGAGVHRLNGIRAERRRSSTGWPRPPVIVAVSGQDLRRLVLTDQREQAFLAVRPVVEAERPRLVGAQDLVPGSF